MDLPHATMDAVSAPPAAQAASTIRAAILNSKFAPGQRLVENDLANQLGFNRGPIREALRVLSAEGLVSIERNRGAFVARASRAIIAEVFEARELLEGLAARRAAERAAASPLRSQLDQALVEEHRRSIDTDGLTLMDANERLHELIFATAGGAVTGRLIGQLQLPELRANFFQLTSPATWSDSVSDHIAVLEAILAGHANSAEDAMRAHVRRTATLFERIADGVLS